MNDWQQIFALSRRSLIFFIVVLVATICLVFAVRFIEGGLKKSLSQTQAEVATRQSQIALSKSDLQNIQIHIQRYDALKLQGLVGEPDRAKWVEEMQKSLKNVGLDGTFKVELLTAKPLMEGSDASMGSGSSPQPLMHDMEFEIADVHEGEVVMLLKDYQSKVKGRFRLEKCRLHEPKAQGLVAQCTLRFITIPITDQKYSPPMVGGM